MQSLVNVLLSALAVHIVATSVSAQPKVTFVDDSLLSYEVTPSTQLRRTERGSILVGPLTGKHIVAQISPDLRQVRPLARHGAGPAEQTGWLVIAAAPGGRTIVVANQLDRTTVLGPSGKVELTTRAIMVPDGVAMCRGRVLLSGLHFGDGTNGTSEGVFEVDTARRVRLLYSTRRGSALRAFFGSTDMLAARGDRLIVGVPNRAELVVSDSGCVRFRTIPVRLPWFVPWDKADPMPAFTKPMQPRVTGVRFISDTRAAMLVIRAYRKAKFETFPGRSAAPIPRGSGPWAETVLVLVDLTTGRVIREQILSQFNWRFASDAELVAHTPDGGDRSGFILRPIEPTTKR
ncbi:MAG: hypothetical protein IBJ19_16650 [Gemmatimonadaceae bacterium]|nr:hypothetical protein [Gemmatimonadaceae bacterium]